MDSKFHTMDHILREGKGIEQYLLSRTGLIDALRRGEIEILDRLKEERREPQGTFLVFYQGKEMVLKYSFLLEYKKWNERIPTTIGSVLNEMKIPMSDWKLLEKMGIIGENCERPLGCLHRDKGELYCSVIDEVPPIREIPNYGIIGSHLFTEPIVSEYVSELYRNGISINFFDIVDYGYYQPDPNTRSFIKFILMEYIRDEGQYASSDDSTTLQLLHAVATLDRYYQMQHDDLNPGNILYHRVGSEETWNGKKLLDADFWAYKVGETMLYFKPTGVIVKLIDFELSLKFSFPAAIPSNNPRHYHYNLAKFNPIDDIDQLMGFHIDDLEGELPDKLKKIHKDKMWDTYLILQSPYIFGEFMHPPDLTEKSNVIVLGTIS